MIFFKNCHCVISVEDLYQKLTLCGERCDTHKNDRATRNASLTNCIQINMEPEMINR